MKLFTTKEENICSEWGEMMSCPECGNQNVHFLSCGLVKGNDHYDAWDGRGNAIRIKMWAECGHYWILRLGEHKGYTFMNNEDIKNGFYELDLKKETNIDVDNS